MSHGDIDRILAGEDEILPSSGFAGAVMEALRREAATPPPIPFPWRRAWPVAAAAVIALAGATVVLHEVAGRAPAPRSRRRSRRRRSRRSCASGRARTRTGSSSRSF